MGNGERSNEFNKWRRQQGVVSTQLYDRFGHPLSEGDIIYLIAKQDVFWRVERCAPVLDPKAPAGTMELVLTSLFVTGLPGGQRVTDVLKVQDGEQIKQIQAARAGNGDGETAVETQHQETTKPEPVQ